jgi:hypothetical protein
MDRHVVAAFALAGCLALSQAAPALAHPLDDPLAAEDTCQNDQNDDETVADTDDTEDTDEDCDDQTQNDHAQNNHTPSNHDDGTVNDSHGDD